MSCLILEDQEIERLERRERRRTAEIVFAVLIGAFFVGLGFGYFWAWKAYGGTFS